MTPLPTNTNQKWVWNHFPVWTCPPVERACLVFYLPSPPWPELLILCLCSNTYSWLCCVTPSPCSLTASEADRAAVRNDAWLRKWVTKAGRCLPAVLNNILSLPVTVRFSVYMPIDLSKQDILSFNFKLWFICRARLEHIFCFPSVCRPLYGLEEGCAWFSFF